MPKLNNRIETSLFRIHRPTSGKIIFISCEGQVTEEEYFGMISTIFSGIKSKIQFVSVMEEILSLPECDRTREQIQELTKTKPWQLVEKIDRFKEKEELRYDFSHHPEDEFWIVADVDENTNALNIEKWNKTLEECKLKNYGYAISNPFFEIWLLLHHVDVNEDDYKFAVTESHEYEKTPHFRERLRNDGQAPLLKGKHIESRHYNVKKIKDAILRAKILHNGKLECWPTNLGSTVYILMEKIIEIADSLN